jgi:hypothetical protein
MDSADIAQRIGSRDLPKGMRIVNNRREEIDGLHQRETFSQQIDSGVIIGIESHEYVRIGLPRQFAQDRIERRRIEFRRATRSLCHRREFHGCGQSTPRCKAL